MEISNENFKKFQDRLVEWINTYNDTVCVDILGCETFEDIEFVCGDCQYPSLLLLFKDIKAEERFQFTDEAIKTYDDKQSG
ncbi:hypothetical protein MesoLj113b_34380 [Mesorhizobium sp. 113-3-3]|nr:hypothetical protein MesoLj113b_34380 [Mesorhizobium sp. 113-3-3]